MLRQSTPVPRRASGQWCEWIPKMEFIAEARLPMFQGVFEIVVIQ